MSINLKIDALLSRYKPIIAKEKKEMALATKNALINKAKTKELLPNGTEEEINRIYRLYEEEIEVLKKAEHESKVAEKTGFQEIEKVLKHELVQEVLSTFHKIQISSIKFASNKRNDGKVKQHPSQCKDDKQERLNKLFMSKEDLSLHYDKGKNRISFIGQVYSVGNSIAKVPSNIEVGSIDISFIAVTFRKKEARKDPTDRTGLVLVSGHCNEELKEWGYVNITGVIQNSYCNDIDNIHYFKAEEIIKTSI